MRERKLISEIKTTWAVLETIKSYYCSHCRKKKHGFIDLSQQTRKNHKCDAASCGLDLLRSYSKEPETNYTTTGSVLLIRRSALVLSETACSCS